ncbi:MAG: MBL fold metallo-hydrolase [bacterium]
MAEHDLFVRFWGVRGSYPVPGQSTIRYGGNTSCIEIRAKNHLIILDAGTGIVELGNELLQKFHQQKASSSFIINLLMSHTHHDHLQGLAFFAPAYHPDCVLNIFGPRSFSQDLSQILKATMAPQYSPIELDELNSKMNIQNLTENHILILNDKSENPQIYAQNHLPGFSKNDVAVKLMRSYAHPKIGVFVIKIEVNNKRLVYATDTEGYVGNDARLIEFARDADLLIHDAQYAPEEYMDANLPKQGFGHSTYEMAARVARTANVKNLVLFHHDPSHDDEKIADMENKTREFFPNTTAGREGLEYTF